MALASVRRPLKTLALPLALAAAITAAAPGWTTIRVRPGDTLWAIAIRYHTSVHELVVANHLPGNGSLIYAGALLEVPARGVAPARAARAGAAVVWRPYRVQPGDCLFCLASRFHVGWRTLAARNHLPSSLVVDVGQVLYVPVRVTVTRSSPRAPGGAVSAAVAEDRAILAGRWEPSRSRTRWLVAEVARQFGVDPALALAISWEESGFNPRVVSSADALGAMQVLPSTVDFVSRYVLGRPLDRYAAQDNIVAGVALLAVLLREARPAIAVAGYYQGLASVTRDGMFPDTRQYVANVLALRAQFAGG